MFEYLIETNSTSVDLEAQQERDMILKPALEGIQCPKHPNQPTIVRFVDGPDGRPVYSIAPCCETFGQRILLALYLGTKAG